MARGRQGTGGDRHRRRIAVARCPADLWLGVVAVGRFRRDPHRAPRGGGVGDSGAVRGQQDPQCRRRRAGRSGRCSLDGVIRSVTLPQVDRNGVMVDFGAALAAMVNPAATTTQYQVWLSSAAPSDMAARLARQHVYVTAHDPLVHLPSGPGPQRAGVRRLAVPHLRARRDCSRHRRDGRRAGGVRPPAGLRVGRARGGRGLAPHAAAGRRRPSRAASSGSGSSSDWPRGWSVHGSRCPARRSSSTRRPGRRWCSGCRGRCWPRSPSGWSSSSSSSASPSRGWSSGPPHRAS